MTAFAEHVTADTADGLLVLAYLAGDVAAFEALYRRYLPDIQRLVHAKANDHAVAEDIAQETMLRALRYLHTYDPQRPFWPWLKTIAMNLLSTERQRRSGEVLVEEVDRGVATFPDGSDAVVSRDAVLSCLDKLPKRQSRALVMRYVEDRDSNDIAALFDLSRNALEQLILRGKTGFKKEYRAQNGAPLMGGFAALAARIRRFLTGFETRLSTVGGTPMFSASDIAIGAALTVSAVGMVAASLSPSSAPVVEALGRGGAGSGTLVVTPAHDGEGDRAANDGDVRNTGAATAFTLLGGSSGAADGTSDESYSVTEPGSSESGATGGTTAAGPIPEKVDETKPKIKTDKPNKPETQPAIIDRSEEVGDPDLVGAEVSTETTADDDGSNSTTEATVYFLGESESIENTSNLGDNNLCVLPGCLE